MSRHKLRGSIAAVQEAFDIIGGFWYRAYQVSITAQTRASESLLAWLMIVWGISLLQRDTVLAFPHFKLLLAVMSEETWGLMAIFVGGMRIVALIVNGAWRRTPLFRFAGAAVGVMWWSTTGILYHATDASVVSPLPMRHFWIVFIVFEMYACFRCGQDAKSQQSI